MFSESSSSGGTSSFVEPKPGKVVDVLIPSKYIAMKEHKIWHQS